MLEDIALYGNYSNYLAKCNKAVNFKLSVQSCNFNSLSYMRDTIDKILNGEIPKVRSARNFYISERGKIRCITPICIEDRVTQKIICEKILIPAIMPSLIEDNGASITGKGTEFARKRVNNFIEKAKREYGYDNIYVLTFDFKNYFNSIRHSECLRVLRECTSDERNINLIIGIIESYHIPEIEKIQDAETRERKLNELYNHEGVGICLGSQISQVMAVAVPNHFDHYIKDVLGMKYYYRHMDDGIIIFNSEERLLQLKDELAKEAAKYGLKFNEAKTRIVKATHGFTFLKVKYRIADGGETIKTLTHRGIAKQRQKLKKFTTKVKNNEMSMDDVYANMQSWLAHSKVANHNYHTVKTMCKLYDELFGGCRITQQYYSQHPELQRKKKVTRF